MKTRIRSRQTSPDAADSFSTALRRYRVQGATALANSANADDRHAPSRGQTLVRYLAPTALCLAAGWISYWGYQQTQSQKKAA